MSDATTQFQDDSDEVNREEWDNVEPLEDDPDTYDVYVVSVCDAENPAERQKKDAFLAFSDRNAKFQAYYAVKDSYKRPKVFYCERVAEDI